MVDCTECGDDVHDSARYTAAEWGICRACFRGLPREKRTQVLNDLPDNPLEADPDT